MWSKNVQVQISNRFKNQTRLYFSQLFFSILLSLVNNQYPNIYEYLSISIVSALGSWL